MRKSKSGLFLMELIIVIFFFALTGAVCLQIFVKAHFMEENATGLDYAILWAENAGETFYEYGPDLDSICAAIPENDDYSVSLNLYEDENYYYLDYSCDYIPTGSHLYDITFKSHIQEVAHE